MGLIVTTWVKALIIEKETKMKCRQCNKDFERPGATCGASECQEKEASAKRKRARLNHKELEQAMKDLGLVKVRGALGGTYWE